MHLNKKTLAAKEKRKIYNEKFVHRFYINRNFYMYLFWQKIQEKRGASQEQQTIEVTQYENKETLGNHVEKLYYNGTNLKRAGPFI